MMWSPSENYLIIGYNNGRVWLVRSRVRTSDGPFSTQQQIPKESSLSTFIEVACGDAIRGSIAGVDLSPDDKCLVVASRDGSCSVHTLQNDKVVETLSLGIEPETIIINRSSRPVGYWKVNVERGRVEV